MEAMADPDEAVKIKAIDYLGKLRATNATTIMVQKLFMRDTGDFERQRLLIALGRISDPKTIRPIAEFVAQDQNPVTQGTALYTLGEIGDSSVIEPLQKVQVESDNPDLVRLAGEAVAKINRRLSPSTVAVTVPALEDDETVPGGTP
jgi:HEAT repeat protein